MISFDEESVCSISVEAKVLYTDITYAVLSSQIGFKSSTITRVEYIGFSYYHLYVSTFSIRSIESPTYLAVC